MSLIFSLYETRHLEQPISNTHIQTLNTILGVISVTLSTLTTKPASNHNLSYFLDVFVDTFCWDSINYYSHFRLHEVCLIVVVFEDGKRHNFSQEVTTRFFNNCG